MINNIVLFNNGEIELKISLENETIRNFQIVQLEKLK